MATSYRVDSFRSPETGETSATGNYYLILAYTSGPTSRFARLASQSAMPYLRPIPACSNTAASF